MKGNASFTERLWCVQRYKLVWSDRQNYWRSQIKSPKFIYYGRNPGLPIGICMVKVSQGYVWDFWIQKF